jgi:hypothetical protein
MKMDESNFDLLRRLIHEEMGEVFLTKDVSEHPKMLAAHGLREGNQTYNKSVGVFLSQNRGRLGIEKDPSKTTSNARWIKNSGTSQPPQPPPQKDSLEIPTNSSPAKDLNSDDLGPQSTSDNAFTAKMRRHQSWYRAKVLRLPFGTGPQAKSKHYYGNMLTQKDGAAGKNFLTPEIAKVAKKRVAQNKGTVEPFRLFHNMLSSQPMCFILFGPLVIDLDLARKLIDALVPERVVRVLRVEIEWAPEPKSEYLNDRTAFDAFVEYLDAEGKKYALGIETKLTEPFSQKEYDSESYRRWMKFNDAPWKADAESRVAAIAHNQLWRDHLLAFALEKHRKSKYSRCHFMLVRHPDDQACEKITNTYRSLLSNEDSFIDMPMDRLIDSWLPRVQDEKNKCWLEAFQERYLNL